MTAPTPAIPIFANGPPPVTQTELNALGSNLTNLYTYGLGGFRTRKPHVSVRRGAATQSIPNSTNTLVQWDTEVFDEDAMWNGAAPDTITINKAGKYNINAFLFMAGSTVGITQINLLVNGTSLATNTVGADVKGNLTGGTLLNAFGSEQLSVGAVIYLSVFQSSGGALSIQTTYGGTRCTVEWVQP